jgi:hypothetical protein
VSETANDVHEALNKARQMYEEGMANVSMTKAGAGLTAMSGLHDRKEENY